MSVLFGWQLFHREALSVSLYKKEDDLNHVSSCWVYVCMCMLMHACGIQSYEAFHFVWWLLKEPVKKIIKTRRLLLTGMPVVTHATHICHRLGLALSVEKSRDQRCDEIEKLHKWTC